MPVKVIKKKELDIRPKYDTPADSDYEKERRKVETYYYMYNGDGTTDWYRNGTIQDYTGKKLINIYRICVGAKRLVPSVSHIKEGMTLSQVKIGVLNRIFELMHHRMIADKIQFHLPLGLGTLCVRENTDETIGTYRLKVKKKDDDVLTTRYAFGTRGRLFRLTWNKGTVNHPTARYYEYIPPMGGVFIEDDKVRYWGMKGLASRVYICAKSAFLSCNKILKDYRGNIIWT